MDPFHVFKVIDLWRTWAIFIQEFHNERINFSTRKIKRIFIIVYFIRVRKLKKHHKQQKTPLNILTIFCQLNIQLNFLKWVFLKIFIADEIEWRSEDSPNIDLEFYKFSFNWLIIWSGFRPTRPRLHWPVYSFDQFN